jgi:hypothetical protein
LLVAALVALKALTILAAVVVAQVAIGQLMQPQLEAVLLLLCLLAVAVVHLR